MSNVIKRRERGKDEARLGRDGTRVAVKNKPRTLLPGRENLTKRNRRAYNKVDGHTLTYTFKRGGKSVGHGKVVIARWQKPHTVTETITAADGKAVNTTSAFDKQ